MSFKTITVGECESAYFLYGLHTVIDNGEVVGFEKSSELGYNSNFISKFVFCAKPKSRGPFF